MDERSEENGMSSYILLCLRKEKNSHQARRKSHNARFFLLLGKERQAFRVCSCSHIRDGNNEKEEQGAKINHGRRVVESQREVIVLGRSVEVSSTVASIKEEEESSRDCVPWHACALGGVC